MDVDSPLNDQLKNEIEKLIANKWDFLNKLWPEILNKYNHRTEIKNFKNNTIQIIKNELLDNLGYITVFYFLVMLYGINEYPAPYKEIDKGLLLLYHILYKKLNNLDCIGTDGGYDQYINTFIEDASNKGYDFNNYNFQYPIRKEKDKKLTINEKNFNKKFGSFRSEIENQFSVLGSKFKRFSNNNSTLQLSDIKYYNLQFRVACLLKNINLMVEKYDIKEEPHHRLWYSDNFEFPSKNSKQNIIFSNEREVNENYNQIINLHDKFLKLDINENNETLDDNENISDSDEEMVDEYMIQNGKRKKIIKKVISIDV
ncbi:hypothetical protein BDA99DRAFT_449402 [Phascolomyces articulosus]|uniref:DDE Tnp4 domain-containing protein n=1 Tax=Phascolomyces articulosus TaxID=60185 RepID=A0AAD5JKY3_9FUNG|nr:hypothetical protein BDA99DRAFT_449402 [Phascolomyces articulosus]